MRKGLFERAAVVIDLSQGKVQRCQRFLRDLRSTDKRFQPRDLIAIRRAVSSRSDKIFMRLGVVGLKRYRLSITRAGRLQVPLRLQSEPEIVVRLGVVRLEPQRCLVGLNRLLHAPLLLQGAPQAVPGLCILR